MKTCKELGWKVGDKFRCTFEDCFKVGEIVTLNFDDNTTIPSWKDRYGNVRYEYTEHFEPLEMLYNKYTRSIKGVHIDVYDVLNAWEVACPATQHAIKKLLMPGQRGSKDALQDLKEAVQAVERAIELCCDTLED